MISSLEDSPLLHTSRDACQTFARKYAELREITKHEHGQPVFFDPKIDTLYLDVTPDILYNPTMNRRRNATRKLEGVQDEEVGDLDLVNRATTHTVESCDTRSDTPAGSSRETSSGTAELTNFGFLASQKVLKSVRHLAVEYKHWQRFCLEHKITLLRDFLPCFPALETLDLVLRPYICGTGEEIKYPLEMEDIEEGAYAWDYTKTAKTKESRAFEETKKRDPNIKIPKWGIKVLKTWNGKAKEEMSDEVANSEWDFVYPS